MSVDSREKHPHRSAHIIRPQRVDLGKKDVPASSQRRHYMVKIVAVLVMLAGLLGGGGWLLKHLSSPTPDRAKMVEPKSRPLILPEDSVAARPDMRPPDAVESEKRSAEKQTVEHNGLTVVPREAEKTSQPDPEPEQARNRLQAERQSIRDQQFEQLMSAGLNAFHQNDYARARANLLEAQSLKPDAFEAADALKQVDEAIQLARIQQLHRAASNAEKMENWEQALKAYLEVLQIDATIQVASHGRQRALQQIQIAKRIDFFLEKPEVLAADQQLANAIQLIGEVAALSPKGPRLAAKEEKLSDLVQVAQIPIKVILESDNLTEVAVYRVAKLGRFLSKELNLRPGTYIVVGAREGYQDVRQKMVITPQQEPTRMRIACTVKL